MRRPIVLGRTAFWIAIPPSLLYLSEIANLYERRQTRVAAFRSQVRSSLGNVSATSFLCDDKWFETFVGGARFASRLGFNISFTNRAMASRLTLHKVSALSPSWMPASVTCSRCLPRKLRTGSTLIARGKHDHRVKRPLNPPFSISTDSIRPRGRL